MTDNELNHPRWNAKWVECAPNTMWDKGVPCPLLIKYLEEGKIPEGKALVPGCGRGYDVTLLATPNRVVLGLDIADLAVEAANSRLAELSSDECSCKANAHFSTTSFFDLPIGIEHEYDFISDYTFLCALNPSVRTTWATMMSKLTKQHGILLTVIYPICDKEGGPPFKMNLEMMSELLLPVGFECLELRLLPTELCHEGRDGSLFEVDAGASSFRSITGVGMWRKL